MITDKLSAISDITRESLPCKEIGFEKQWRRQVSATGRVHRHFSGSKVSDESETSKQEKNKRGRQEVSSPVVFDYDTIPSPSF